MTPEAYKRHIGENMRLVLEAVDRRPADAARDLQVSKERLNNWLQGHNYPDIYAVFRMCSLYGCTFDFIFRRRLDGIPLALAADLQAKTEALEAGAPQGQSLR
jgi:transcriptional regulator with XRE-family HTH domain